MEVETKDSVFDLPMSTGLANAMLAGDLLNFIDMHTAFVLNVLFDKFIE